MSPGAPLLETGTALPWVWLCTEHPRVSKPMGWGAAGRGCAITARSVTVASVRGWTSYTGEGGAGQEIILGWPQATPSTVTAGFARTDPLGHLRKGFQPPVGLDSVTALVWLLWPPPPPGWPRSGMLRRPTRRPTAVLSRVLVAEAHQPLEGLSARARRNQTF